MFNKQEVLRTELGDIARKLTVGEEGDYSLRNLSDADIAELRRDLLNTREHLEIRINNLLYKASRRMLNDAGFSELQELRKDLRLADKIEAALWQNAGPLGDLRVGVDFTRAANLTSQEYRHDSPDMETSNPQIRPQNPYAGSGLV